jgi:DNA-binding NarL/FixJ family response regulator
VYKAMIVHESWIMKEILKEELAQSDCRVVCYARTRLEATLAYRLHRPDVVFVDAKLKNSGGTVDDLLDIDSRAIVISTVSPNEDTAALHALLSGAQGILVIPSTPEVFRQELEHLLQSKPVSRLIASIPKHDLKHFFTSAFHMLSDLGDRMRKIAKPL